ncbi:MAG: hypothetical protein QXT37_10130 [Thermofilaceae archaeon]
MEDFVKALADRIYEDHKGRRVTLDRRGRPSYVAVYAMVKALVRLALENGLDPAAVDFYALIDPDLTRGENIAAIARSLRLKLEGPYPFTDAYEEEIHALRSQIGELEAAIDQATGEEKKALMEELNQLNRQLRDLEAKRRVEAARRAVEKRVERARRAAEARARRAIEEARRRAEERRRAPPPAPPAAPLAPAPAPPPPPPPAPPPAPPAPPPTAPPLLEEVRRRVEDELRRRVAARGASIYRVDWRDLRARVSCLRRHEDAVRAAIEEMDGRVVEVRRTDTLTVIYADFTGARVPVAPVARGLTPEEERMLLWLKFSTVLRSWGYDPERFRSDFEAALRLTEGRPLPERQEVLDRMLTHLRPPPTPPAELVERVVGEAVRRLEEAARRLTEAARAPPTIETARIAMLAAMPEPAVTIGPCPNAAGLPDHSSVQPVPECVGAMKLIGIHPLLIEWWMSCPACRGFLPGGYLKPSEWVKDVFDLHGLYPAIFKPWFERLARLKEEAEGTPAR